MSFGKPGLILFKVSISYLIDSSIQASRSVEKPRPVCFLIYGFNIAVLVAILLGISRPFAGLRWSAWVAISGVIIYTILVSAKPSVVRAAVMAAIFIFAGNVMDRLI